MSQPDDTPGGENPPADEKVDAPDDLLDPHPETAYFWGRVAGDGRVTDRAVVAETADEAVAERLAAIAGADSVDHRIAERAFAHDTAVTRQADAYTVELVDPSLATTAAHALGLPTDDEGAESDDATVSPAVYRFDRFAAHRRPLLRGLLEACGVVCFRESAGAVGVSFVHDDDRLLRRVRALLEAVDVGSDSPQSASSGGYWFGIDDADTTAFAEWVYAGTPDSGLFATDRRQKTLRSVERAAGLAVGTLVDADSAEASAGPSGSASTAGGADS